MPSSFDRILRHPVVVEAKRRALLRLADALETTNALRRRRDNNALIEMGLLSIGEHTFGDFEVVVGHPRPELAELGGTVSIGRFCSIADGVTIMQNVDHRTDWVTTYPLRRRLGTTGEPDVDSMRPRGPIVIGNDVWIGQDARIMSGVTIGDGAVIGSGSIVTRDVPPYAIAVGVPAAVIRQRFAAEQIEQLRASRWWDWPPDRIRAATDLLCGGDIEAFLAAAAVSHAPPSSR